MKTQRGLNLPLQTRIEQLKAEAEANRRQFEADLRAIQAPVEKALRSEWQQNILDQIEAEEWK